MPSSSIRPSAASSAGTFAWMSVTIAARLLIAASPRSGEDQAERLLSVRRRCDAHLEFVTALDDFEREEGAAAVLVCGQRFNAELERFVGIEYVSHAGRRLLARPRSPEQLGPLCESLRLVGGVERAGDKRHARTHVGQPSDGLVARRRRRRAFSRRAVVASQYSPLPAAT